MGSSGRGAAVAVALAAALLAACGGGSSTKTATAPATTTTLSGQAARQAYRQCLQQHGVSLPTPTSTAGGADLGGGPPVGGGPASTIPPAAAQACARLRPAGGFGGGPGGAGAAQLRSAYQAFKSCMVDHGYTALPDLPTTPPTTPSTAPSTGPPSTGAGGGRGRGGTLGPVFQAIQTSRTANPAAYNACAALLPQGRGGGSASTTTSILPTA